MFAAAVCAAIVCACAAPALAVKPDRSPRIVGGTTASISDWPYTVALATSGGEQFCGGSLIGRRTVLTAAHCVTNNNGDPEDPSDWFVVAGRTNLTLPGGQVTTVDLNNVHPWYDAPSTSYDMALLTLSDPISTSVISNQDLIAVDNGSAPWDVGTRVFSAGWGNTVSGDDNSGSANQLKQVGLDVLSDDDCLAASFGFNGASQICAGDGDFNSNDTCQGDSGGPLVESGEDVGGSTPADDILIGVVSFGEGCADGKPAAYSWLAAPYMRKFLLDPNWDGSLPRPAPVRPTPRPVPAGVSAKCKSAGSKLSKARKKFKRAAKKLKKAKRAYKKHRTRKNRKRVKKAKKSYKKAKKGYSRAKKAKTKAC